MAYIGFIFLLTFVQHLYCRIHLKLKKKKKKKKKKAKHDMCQ